MYGHCFFVCYFLQLEAELNELRDKVSTQAPEKGDTSLLKYFILYYIIL